MSNDIPYEVLAVEIEGLAAAHPHVAPLLRAFGPLLVAKERWLQETPAAAPVAFDQDRFRNGVAILQQGPLFTEDDPWSSAGCAVARGIGQGFPLFAGEMTTLAAEITAGGLDCYALLDGGAASAADSPGRKLFLEFLARFMLARVARSLAKSLAPLTWNKDYCPVCAGLPQLAILRDKGQRVLQCAHCSHEWPFSRLTCPACGHEDPEDSRILFVEGRKEDSVFTCSNCRKYLITGDRSGAFGQINADVIAMSLVHLDFIAQGQGLAPMAVCPWNTLPATEEGASDEG